jgi:hypothetical protein
VLNLIIKAPIADPQKMADVLQDLVAAAPLEETKEKDL